MAATMDRPSFDDRWQGNLREHSHPDEYPCQPHGRSARVSAEPRRRLQKRPPRLEPRRSEAEWEELLAKPGLSAFDREVTPLDKFATSTSWQRHVSPSLPDPSSPGRWKTADETLFIIDWDDTLFPTSHIRADPRLSFEEAAPCFRSTPRKAGLEGEHELSRMRAQLEQHADAVRDLLVLASSMGGVAIVTLAQRSWVEDSIARFMPSLRGLFDELDIHVVEARSAATLPCQRATYGEGRDLGQFMKTQAIAWVARCFYGTGRGGGTSRSWKNVLSIGDSEAERLALQDVLFRRVQTDGQGNWRECRCKTLKLIEEPTLDQLTGQLRSLTSWLGHIARHDGDVDVDFGELLQDPDNDLAGSPPSSPRACSPEHA